MKKKFSSAIIIILAVMMVFVSAFSSAATDDGKDENTDVTSVTESVESTTEKTDSETTEPSTEEETTESETTTEENKKCPDGEHKYVFKADKKATLTEDGLEFEICNICGDIKNETVVHRITDIVLSSGGKELVNNEIEYDGRYHYVSVKMYDAGGNVHTENYFLEVKGTQDAKEIGTYKLTVSYKDYNYDIPEQEISYSIVAPKIPQPTGFTAKSTKTGVKLTWEKVKDSAGYEVYRKLSTSSNWTKLETITKTEYLDTTAQYNKEYNYMVKAYKVVDYKNFYSDGEEGVTLVTKYVITPAAPTLEVINGGVKVTWTKVAGAGKYEVYRYDSNSGSYVKIATTKSNVVSYSDKKITLGKNYYYKIKAYTGTKASAFSAYAKIQATLTAPVIKKNINATSTAFTFSWNKIDKADGYFIYKIDGKNYTKVAEIKDKNTTQYTYKSKKLVRLVVTAYFKNSSGKKIQSSYSKTIFAKALAKPTITFEVSAYGMTIYVNSSVDSNSYQIYYKEGKNGSWKLLEKGNQSFSTHKTISAKHDVTLNKNYYYKIRAVEIKADNTIYGEYSAVKQLTFGYIPGVTVTLPNKNYNRGQGFTVTVKNAGKKTICLYGHGEIFNANLADSGNIFTLSGDTNISSGKTVKIVYTPKWVTSPVIDTKMPAYGKNSKIALYFRCDGIEYVSVYNVKTGQVYKK